MRKLLLLLATAGAACLAGQNALAQGYYYLPFVAAGQNPGGLNNDVEAPVGGGLPAGWTTILASTAAPVPVWSPVQTLPFGFSLGGQAVQQYVVSSSGVLTFNVAAAGSAVPDGNNYLLPDPSIPDQSICLWGLAFRAPGGSNLGDFIVTKTFGTAPHRQHWVQFNSVSDAVANTTTYWSMVLEEGSNTVYLVDQRASGNVSLSAGIQLNATTALAVNNSASLNSRAIATNDPSPADNSYYAFYPGQQPAYDALTRSISLDAIQPLTAAPYVVAGELRNLGTQALSTYTLNYSVNGGATVSAPVTANVAPLAIQPFAHPTPWTPPAPGTYTLRVWASALNGQPDGNPANDTISKVIAVSDVAVPRQVVEEVFTSSTCPPCRPGNANLEVVHRQNPGKWVAIKYQQNFPAPGNDPYYTAESGGRFDYYGLNSIPHMMVDGGWSDNANAYSTAVMDRFYNVPAYVAMDAVYTLNAATRTVAARVQVLPVVDVPGDQIVLYSVITERHTRNNARTNGETDFYNVMKKMLPDENGQVLAPLQNRQVQTVPQTYTFPVNNNVEHFDSLQVVFFVQNRLTNKVYQGMTARLNGTLGVAPTITPLGVAEAQALAAGFQVYPNPATGGAATLAVQMPVAGTVAVEVLDALGRRVAGLAPQLLAAGPQQLLLPVGSLPNGLYSVRLTRGGATRALRLVVAK